MQCNANTILNVMRIEGEGGGGGGSAPLINREPKDEGTCNFTYLVRKVRLNFIPNYS